MFIFDGFKIIEDSLLICIRKLKIFKIIEGKSLGNLVYKIKDFEESSFSLAWFQNSYHTTEDTNFFLSLSHHAVILHVDLYKVVLWMLSLGCLTEF